jgi:hypothetical protein
MVAHSLGLVLLISAGYILPRFGVSATVNTALVWLALSSVTFGLAFVSLRPWVVRFTEEGYRVRYIRGAGTSSANWSDVEDLATAEVAGAKCLVLRLTGDRRTVVPVEMLELPNDEIVGLFRERLDRGHGQQRL